jgi:putative intracellular protease/amidase
MKRVAMVLSTVGYHWEEAFAAYREFSKASYEVAPFTVNGDPPRADPMSLKRTGPLALAGIGVPSRIAPETERGREFGALLQNSRHIAELDPAAFVALYLPGGHGCLFDVNRNEALHDKIAQLHQRGAILSAVCHATSTFAFVSVGDRPIVQGHAITGFPHPLDRALIKVGGVQKTFLPLPLVNDDELIKAGAKLRKADIVEAIANPFTIRVSPPFVTGVGPRAARRVARRVIDLCAEQPETTGVEKPVTEQHASPP